ncbi:TetR/AcrR family transcriptional regulator [Nocardia sp. 2]|uniref:TetR/AcrR family transcriptional regulator n=1 Tax=Nocardia acididurans TaxID=2802282 RepID=A0ABS1MC21_9NOCA|nr:TetR/AcrR family transcriptional regulator [Nocardia acididurans]MBL1076733.1 TetR/AcrR family transcriptional regulator [Nocardia acididurans]
MPPTKDRYHHGALREELLRASLHLIETEGLAAVSLRKVARAAGVSPGAPYHHFADRSALLAALSSRGFELLRDRLAAACTSADTIMGTMIAMADAYVRFAREQPAYFRLMFRPELSQPEKNPETEHAGDAAFAVLEDAVAEAIHAGALPAAEADTLIMAWWAMAHGLASLEIDGKLVKRAGEMGTTADALAERITRLFAGLIETAQHTRSLE